MIFKDYDRDGKLVDVRTSEPPMTRAQKAPIRRLQIWLEDIRFDRAIKSRLELAARAGANIP